LSELKKYSHHFDVYICLQEGEVNEYQTKLKEATWSSHVFRVSVTQNEYNGEKRQRVTVKGVAPLDFAAETRLLLQDISNKNKTSQ
jgi:replication factor A1